MTVSTVQSSAVFLGNGATTSFGFSFNNGVPFNSNASLATYTVIYTDVSGNQTTLAPSVYTLSFNAAVTGTLWGLGGTLVYPISGSPIASGISLTLNRVFPLQQLTSISNQGDFAPQNIEAMGDIEEMQLQQIAARTAQQRGVWASGIQYNSGDIVIDGSNGANTGNYYSCVTPNVSGTWSTDLATGYWSLAINVQIIAGYATSAAASAATATTEALTATAEAAIATTQANTATTEAGVATTQAGIATTQAASATASAASASTSESNASTSATSAAASAATATTQASNASASASSASASATNAATSATAAAASAVAAGSTLTATSTTSNTIGTGNFTFTTQANKNFFPGQPIIAASNANGANYIHGIVSSYSGTTLIITEQDTGGSGTHSDWNISVTGSQGPSGGGTGTVTTASVVTANGFAGSVANPTTTPAITLTTSINAPVLAGNGTAIAAATTTGSGSTVVLATSPTLVTPALGTPASGVLTNCTGTASGLTAGHVTTNANLTGVITSSGNATSIASQTGTGTKFVVDTSPTLVTPNIGAATGTSLNLSGLTASSAVATDGSKNLTSVTNTGTGSNVLATSPTLVTPALGTPSSGDLSNCTGIPVALMTPLGVGSIILAQNNLGGSGTTAPGGTIAAVSLTPMGFATSSAQAPISTADSLSGTWKALQSSNASSSSFNLTLFQRIA